jgi:predicted DCC family thiol-disulfide oxidoreductase YuxK
MNLPKHLILFDGDCAFCNRSVQFILKYDHQKIFFFSSLESETGLSVKQEFGLSKTYCDSLIYIRQGKLLVASEAAVWIGSEMRFPVNLLAGLYLFPSVLRNSLYSLIAKNRESILKKRNTCLILEENQKYRFI